MKTLIHPTAVIDPEADLHPSVQVGPYAVIGPSVTIGEDTVIAAHVVIDGNTTIGARNRIFPGAAIGLETQDLKYTGQVSRVEIGDDNLIREYVTINRATGADEVTRIGNHNLLMAYVHVAHNCILEDRVIAANSVALAGHVYVESGARLSGLVGVHQFVHVGRLAMVGGLTKIERDVPPFTMVAGTPSAVRGLNQVGLQRSGMTEAKNGETYRELKQAFRLVYHSGALFKDVVEELNQWEHNELVRHFRDFIAASQGDDRRGITPSRRSKGQSAEV